MAFVNSALLLIDVQSTWSRADAIKQHFPEFAANTRKLVQLARDNNMLVVHLHADYSSDNTEWFDDTNALHTAWMYENNKPDLQIIKALPNEKRILKSTFDGFYKTTLDEYLKSKNIENVYFSGLVTSICVINTINGAIKRGYNIFVVEDCCADVQRKYHEATIQSYYGFNFCQIVKVKNYLLTSKL
eukprot:UN01373